MKAPIPPEADATAVPLLAPHDEFVIAGAAGRIVLGCVTVTVDVAVAASASVIVIIYVPAERLLAVLVFDEVIPLAPLLQLYV